MGTFTEENYLKAIYKLSERSAEAVSTNAIAEVMSTKAASVTDMLKKLAEKKWIDYKKYQGVTLTKEGERLAIEIVRKHRLWEVFLVEKLGLRWDEVHDIAEELEHINSDKLVENLDKFLGFPKFDPHGDPIPSKSGKFIQSNFHAMIDMRAGDKGVVSGVIDHSPLFLQYLDKLKLNLGKKITVSEKNEYDGLMEIEVAGNGKIQISKEVARNVLVAVQ